jgi:N-methylhydantoinase B
MRFLPYCNFAMCKDDILYMRVASGGGYGDPREREPERVRSDVLNGIVSREVACEIYGVVLEGSTLDVDFAATRDLREESKRKELE